MNLFSAGNGRLKPLDNLDFNLSQSFKTFTWFWEHRLKKTEKFGMIYRPVVIGTRPFQPIYYRLWLHLQTL